MEEKTAEMAGTIRRLETQYVPYHESCNSKTKSCTVLDLEGLEGAFMRNREAYDYGSIDRRLSVDPCVFVMSDLKEISQVAGAVKQDGFGDGPVVDYLIDVDLLSDLGHLTCAVDESSFPSQGKYEAVSTSDLLKDIELKSMQVVADVIDGSEGHVYFISNSDDERNDSVMSSSHPELSETLQGPESTLDVTVVDNSDSASSADVANEEFAATRTDGNGIPRAALVLVDVGEEFVDVGDEPRSDALSSC